MGFCGLLPGKRLQASLTTHPVGLAGPQVGCLLQGLNRGAGWARWTY